MVAVTARCYIRAPGRSVPVYLLDDTADLTLAFFVPRPRGSRVLPIGQRRWVSGKIELFDGMRQMVHPDRIVDESGLKALPLIEPVYPLTEGLYPRQIQKAAQEALVKTPDLPEWQDPAWLKNRGWPGFREALDGRPCPADARGGSARFSRPPAPGL